MDGHESRHDQPGQNTLRAGPLTDQSATYGIIHQVEALGLQLLEIRWGPGQFAEFSSEVRELPP